MANPRPERSQSSPALGQALPNTPNSTHDSYLRALHQVADRLDPELTSEARNPSGDGPKTQIDALWFPLAPAPDAVCEQVRQFYHDDHIRGITICDDGVTTYCNWETGPQRECVAEHERIHVQDMQNKCPTQGLVDPVTTWPERVKTEAHAYRVMVDCLNRKLAEPLMRSSDRQELARMRIGQEIMLRYWQGEVGKLER